MGALPATIKLSRLLPDYRPLIWRSSPMLPSCRWNPTIGLRLKLERRSIWLVANAAVAVLVQKILGTSMQGGQCAKGQYDNLPGRQQPVGCKWAPT